MVVDIYDVWYIAYSITSSSILIGPSVDVWRIMVAPVVSARRMAIIPKVSTAQRGDIRMPVVIYEVVMVEFVIKRLEEVDAKPFVVRYVVSGYFCVVRLHELHSDGCA